MSDVLLSFGLSNLLLSMVLAVAAWCVQRRGRTPWLAHLLWMLVLVKLVTPPLVTAPLFTFASDAAATTALLDDVSLVPGTGAGLAALPALGEGAPLAAADPTSSNGPTLAAVATSVVLWVWALGSLAVLVLSLARIARFARRLRASVEPADDRLVRMAAHLAQRLGLRRAPRLVVVDADLAPLVWWLGGRSEVVLPRAIVDGLDSRALRLVVAHELAHLRRRDHLVRWVEWGATVLFWWNPVLWFARRGLRENEELCCDALVLAALDADPNTYANSLLDALELLATPALRPPAVASQMTSGGSLEHRLTMIVNASTLAGPSRRLRAVVLAVAALVLPLGIASAQDPDYDAVGARLMEAVEAGELSEAQAKAMFGALAEEHFGAALESRRGTADRERVDPRTLRQRELAESLVTVVEDPPHADLAERKERHAKLDAELKALLKAGRISKQDAQRKLEAIERELFGERDMEERKQRHAQVEADVKTMLESGWISKAEAEERLARSRQQLFGPDPMEVRKQRYAAAEGRTKVLLESGFMSKAEAARELEELHRELFGAADDAGHSKAYPEGLKSDVSEMAARRKRYAEAEAKVKTALGAGLVGPKEAERRLEALRLELFGAPHRGSGERLRLHEIGYVDTVVEEGEILRELGYVEDSSIETAIELLEIDTDLLEVEVDLLEHLSEIGYVETVEEEVELLREIGYLDDSSIDTTIELLEIDTDVLEVEVDLLEHLSEIGYVEIVEEPVVVEEPVTIE